MLNYLNQTMQVIGHHDKSVYFHIRACNIKLLPFVANELTQLFNRTSPSTIIPKRNRIFQRK